MKVWGIIEEGSGVAGRQLKPCHAEIRSRTGINPVPGTLNIRVNIPVYIPGDFELSRGACNDTDEWVRFQRCVVEDRVEAVIMQTSTRHHGPYVLEIMAGVNLQDALAVRPGDRIAVESHLEVDLRGKSVLERMREIQRQLEMDPPPPPEERVKLIVEAEAISGSRQVPEGP